MEQVSLKQIFFGGVTMQVPEIWNVETEDLQEFDGQKSDSIDITAGGKDVRTIDISFGPLPEGSDAYSEACGTYEEVVGEDDLETNDEPILCFDFQGKEAHGFSLTTEDNLPCFFFCVEDERDGKKNLLTVLLCAADNENLQSLLDFVEEYLSVK